MASARRPIADGCAAAASLRSPRMPTGDRRRPTLDDAKAGGGPLLWVVLPFVASYLFGRWLVESAVRGLARGIREAIAGIRRVATMARASVRTFLAAALRSWRRFA